MFTWSYQPFGMFFLSCDAQGESMNFESVMLGLEAVQISLTIMTGSSMAKQIYKEEVWTGATVVLNEPNLSSLITPV